MKKGLLATSFGLWLTFSGTAFAAPVDINTADAQTIAAALNGIGPAKAATLVEYRKAHGPFKDLASLEKVPGIGAKTLEKNKDNILFKSAPATPAPAPALAPAK